ncbi:phenylalanyl-tRNA synthetase [Cavenderia fasciculata]|uniref:phenylalanine--tRNA ligase n=1 Tax=Cavenderia fasciculata TaxID=261658 RepID=F4PXN0_CACFS|nr:phenylalanyl-tRNA synthetase [Cavenderia fasciculata]EGG19540.1 phenylalanyl-tRNA synthetase [Cavenderia fasciculata]|eukprot:XP_004357834.1 phenylalanyl-tRNA synthetase [Cavenderia fasciculata]
MYKSNSVIICLIISFCQGQVTKNISCIIDDGHLFDFCPMVPSSLKYYSYAALSNIPDSVMTLEFYDGLVLDPTPIDANGTTCYRQSNSSLKIDAFIRDAVYSAQNNTNLYTNYSSSVSEAKASAIECIEFIAMRLCTLTFRANYPDLEDSCGGYCPSLFKKCNYTVWPVAYEPTFNGQSLNITYQMFPKTLDECYAGILTNTTTNCTVATLSKALGNFDYNFVVPGEEVESVVPGTLLGFGLLLAFLLLIGTLAFIMKLIFLCFLLFIVSINGESTTSTDGPVCIEDKNNDLFGFCKTSGNGTGRKYGLEELTRLGIRLTSSFMSSLSRNGTNECHVANGTYKIDVFIRDAIYSTQHNPRFYTNSRVSSEKATADALNCAELLAIRLCTMAFRYDYPNFEDACGGYCEKLVKMVIANFDEILFKTLDVNKVIENTREWATQNEWDHQELVGHLKSWESMFTIKCDNKDMQTYELTANGKDALDNGSPEYRMFNDLPVDGVTMKEANEKYGSTAFGAAKNKGWVKVDKGKVVKNAETVEDVARKLLSNLSILEKKDIDALKKDKFVMEKKITYFTVSQGEKYNIRKKEVSDLTMDMLKNNSWKDETFKFNTLSMGTKPDSGFRHPLNKVKAEFKQIFIEMGFEEMPTSNYVENSFWNFDALFQPQQHPARDAHDTFFLSDPKTSHDFTDEHLEKVRKVHSEGGYGSWGWRYDWKLEEAEKNILRTHTTAVSSRMLYKLANQPGGFTPKKYFSVDRVFRNESLDATHLAEFHQVEGLVAGYDISLSNLIGIFSEFFKRLGIEDIQFKPAFNPYTEPSMEIFGVHSKLGRMELGNSGLFRPEMLLPLGLPEGVQVAAWGLSLERPTMIKYGLNTIRDIFGNNLNIEFIQSNPICMFPPTKTL